MGVRRPGAGRNGGEVWTALGRSSRPQEQRFGWTEGAGHLLTVRAVAGRLGISTATVYKLVARGDLPHVRVSNAIRVTPDVLDSFLANQRRGPADRTGEGR